MTLARRKIKEFDENISYGELHVQFTIAVIFQPTEETMNVKKWIDFLEKVTVVAVAFVVIGGCLLLAAYWYQYEWSLGPELNELNAGNVMHIGIVVFHLAMLVIACTFALCSPLANIKSIDDIHTIAEDFQKVEIHGRKTALVHTLIATACLIVAFVCAPVFFLSLMLVFQTAAIGYVLQSWMAHKLFIRWYGSAAKENAH